MSIHWTKEERRHVVAHVGNYLLSINTYKLDGLSHGYLLLHVKDAQLGFIRERRRKLPNLQTVGAWFEPALVEYLNDNKPQNAPEPQKQKPEIEFRVPQTKASKFDDITAQFRKELNAL